MVVTNEATNSAVFKKNAADLDLLKLTPDSVRNGVHLCLQIIVLERDNDFKTICFIQEKYE